MAKPIRALELHYPIIQFLVISGIQFIPLYSLLLSFFVKMTIKRMRKKQRPHEVWSPRSEHNILLYCIMPFPITLSSNSYRHQALMSPKMLTYLI